jgi:Integrase core domain
MSLSSRRELARAQSVRYWKASRSEKGRILAEFVQATGYSRKHAITLLRRPPKADGERRTRKRKRIYTEEVQRVLVWVWEIAGFICAKRLVAGLSDLLQSLERHGELQLEPITRSRLLSMSAATADRLLRQARYQRPRRGLCTTKPGTLLRQQIAVRTSSEWSENTPGFFEIDLVAHGGDSAAGDYLYSLVLTDVHTGWTECLALPNRGQGAVTHAIHTARNRLPFPLLGIDSDNGSEFINNLLANYCTQHNIKFTRCRPYRKNDQCHVEQKNWVLVRQIIGYDRYEGDAPLRHMRSLYAQLRLFTNFFQPSARLKGKTRNGARVTKHYDMPATPYRRLLEAGILSEEEQAQLQELFQGLNPAGLQREIREARNRLFHTPKVRNTNEATMNPRYDS